MHATMCDLQRWRPPGHAPGPGGGERAARQSHGSFVPPWRKPAPSRPTARLHHPHTVVKRRQGRPLPQEPPSPVPASTRSSIAGRPHPLRVPTRRASRCSSATTPDRAPLVPRSSRTSGDRGSVNRSLSVPRIALVRRAAPAPGSRAAASPFGGATTQAVLPELLSAPDTCAVARVRAPACSSSPPRCTRPPLFYSYLP